MLARALQVTTRAGTRAADKPARSRWRRSVCSAQATARTETGAFRATPSTARRAAGSNTRSPGCRWPRGSAADANGRSAQLRRDEVQRDDRQVRRALDRLEAERREQRCGSVVVGRGPLVAWRIER